MVRKSIAVALLVPALGCSASDTSTPGAHDLVAAGDAAAGLDSSRDGGGVSDGSLDVDDGIGADVDVRDARHADAGLAPDAGPTWFDEIPPICPVPRRFAEAPTDTLVELGRTDGWAEFAGDLDQDGRDEVYVLPTSEGVCLCDIPVHIVGAAVDGRAEILSVWAGVRVYGMGDVNGDGRPDLAGVTVELKSDRLRSRIGAWTTSQPSSLQVDIEIGRIDPELFSSPAGFIVADLVGDSAAEIAVSSPTRVFAWNRALNGLELVYTDSDPDWPASLNFNNFGTMTSGDYDGDGRAEIVLPANVPPPDGFLDPLTFHAAHRVIEPDESGQFQVVYRAPMPAFYPWLSASGDIDGDGDPEFFQGGSTESKDCWYLAVFDAVADNTYERLWTIDFGPHGNADHRAHVAMGDTDGDGDDDLVVSYGDLVQILDWDKGAREFRLAAELPGCESCQRNDLELADLDGDGAKEIVVTQVVYEGGLQIEEDAVTFYRRVPLGP